MSAIVLPKNAQKVSLQTVPLRSISNGVVSEDLLYPIHQLFYRSKVNTF